VEVERIYIAGKVSGEDYEKVKKKFNTVEAHLLFMASNTIVYNPTTYVKLTDSWAKSMKICIKLLTGSDTIYLLKDFKSSRGAIIEYFIANVIGLKIIHSEFNFKHKKNIKNIILYKILSIWVKILKNTCFFKNKDYICGGK